MICINESEFQNRNISAFSLRKAMNSHSECEVRFVVGDADQADFIGKLGKQISIKNDSDYIFFGTIDRITVEKKYSGDVLIVHSVSKSIESDTKKHKRIFQNPRKSLNDIINYINGTYSGNGKISLCGNDIGISKCIIQNDETDFDFLNRLAQENGYRLIVNSTDNELDLQIGEYNRDFQGLNYKDIKNHCEKFDQISELKKSSICLVLREASDTYFSLGQRIRFGDMDNKDNKIYYVDSSEIVMERSAYKYKYVLIELIEADYRDQPHNIDIPPIMLKGIVTDSRDPEGKGRIQVRFDCDYDDVQSDKPAWIPVETPYTASNGGIVFIPDINDVVDVKCINGKLYASMSFGNNKIDDRFINTADKYISNVNGKWIGLKDKSLEICSGDNVSITLSDNNIKLKVKDTSIIMTDNEVRININGTNIILNDDIKAECSGDVFVKGRNISQKANAAVKIKGTEIELN